jgi:hypothetical protein
MNKKKIFILICLTIILIFGIGLYSAFDDKKNNIPDSVEKYIPSFVKDFILNDLFIVTRLKNRILRLETSLKNIGDENREEKKINDIILTKLYEDGLNKLEFFKTNNHLIESSLSKNYKVETFQTLYLSAGTWPHTRASAYLDVHEENIFLVSKNAVFSFFKINELQKKKFNSIIISSNFKELVKNKKVYEHGGLGIKDILINDDKIYVSYSNVDNKNCANTAILVAKLNTDYLFFENFFTPNTCVIRRSGHNRWSFNAAGGKMVSYKKDFILYSHGSFKTRVAAQDDETVFGKILLINKDTKEWSIFSKGHRNIQGLYFSDKDNIVLSTEHGPQGGDEININIIDDNKEKNFGWPISSYGEHYGGKKHPQNDINYKEAPLYKSHKEFGFIEPLKYFVPSIGITEISKIPSSYGNGFNNDYFVGAMGKHVEEGDKSLHRIKIDDKFTKVIQHEIIPFNERIRDLIYVEKLNKFILFLENSASLAIISPN